MSEETTTPAVGETAEVNVEAMTTEEFLAFNDGGWADSSTIADVAAFDAARETIMVEMPKAFRAQTAVDKAVAAQSAIRTAIALAIIAVRNSISFHDKPDTFGISDAYRKAFEERIVTALVRANKGMSKDWVKGELKAVRTGYLNESGTRAKGMVFEGIILHAVESGEIPGATVREDGKVIIPVFKKDKNTGQQVPATETLKDPETGKPVIDASGEKVMVPTVRTYTPGQSENVPAILKDKVREVIRERDRRDSENRPMTKVPVRFGGKKGGGGGGDKKDEPRAWNEEFEAALATIAEATGHTASMFQVQAFHKAAGILVHNLNAQHVTNPDEHAAVLENVWQGLKIECAILKGHTGATLDQLAAFFPQDATPAEKAEQDATDAEAEASAKADSAEEKA